MDYDLIESCEKAMNDEKEVLLYNFYGDANGRWVAFANLENEDGIVVSTGTYKAIDTWKEFSDDAFDKASKRFKREVEIMFDSF